MANPKDVRINILGIIEDYIAVNEGKMSQLFFCKKYNVNFRKFTKLAYVIEAELEAENKRLEAALEKVKIMAFQIGCYEVSGQGVMATKIERFIEQALKKEK